MRATLGEHIHDYLVRTRSARSGTSLPGHRDRVGARALSGGVVAVHATKTSNLHRADSLDNAHKFQQVLSELDVDVAAGSSVQFKKLLAAAPQPRSGRLRGARRRAGDGGLRWRRRLLEEGAAAMLVIVDEDQLAEFRLPVSGARADFVVHGASAARVRGAHPPAAVARQRGQLRAGLHRRGRHDGEPGHLPGEGRPASRWTSRTWNTPCSPSSSPIPGRTYSRDALLRRVWGFDYYGGSRTVDVHVRRVRAKLGPELAQRLETVRGVGYLWNA